MLKISSKNDEKLLHFFCSRDILNSRGKLIRKKGGNENEKVKQTAIKQTSRND